VNSKPEVASHLLALLQPAMARNSPKQRLVIDPNAISIKKMRSRRLNVLTDDHFK
jgi:hypothetical protein